MIVSFLVPIHSDIPVGGVLDKGRPALSSPPADAIAAAAAPAFVRGRTVKALNGAGEPNSATKKPQWRERERLLV